MQSSTTYSQAIRGRTFVHRSGRITSGTSKSIPLHKSSALSYRSSFSSDSLVDSNPLLTLSPALLRFLATIIVISVGIVLTMPYYSDSVSMAEQSVVAKIDGGLVNVLRANSRGIEALYDGQRIPIRVNDMVSAETGTAQLKFFDNQVVSISPSGRLTIERYEVNDLGKRLEYMVWSGHVVHQSLQNTGDGDWIQISTPSSTASIRNATVSILIASSEQTVYQVDSGVVWITMGEDEIFLGPNEYLVADGNQPLVKKLGTPDEKEVASISYMPLEESVENSTKTPVRTVGELLDTRTSPADSQPRLVSTQAQLELSLTETDQWLLHTVQPGDSFWTIATEHAISVESLTKANPEVADLSILTVGQQLRIPHSVN